MKYLGDLKNMQIPQSTAKTGTGTWTLSFDATLKVVKYAVAAAAQTATLYFPIQLPQDMDANTVPAGAKILDFVVQYKVGTLALTGVPTANIYSVTEPADGSAKVPTTIACTCAAKASAVALTTAADHTMTVTPNTDIVLDGNTTLTLELNFPQAATSTVDVNQVHAEYYPLLG